MKLRIDLSLNLVLHFMALYPSMGSDISPKEESKQATASLTDLPSELMVMILSRPKVYDSFIRAVPMWHGDHEIELNCLTRVLSVPFLSWDDLNEAGYMALRLAAPKPIEPEDPDISVVPPAAVFKWIRFLRKHHELKSVDSFEINLSAFLFYFARSRHFDSWYALCSEDEKSEFKEYIGKALNMAGKVFSAERVLGVSCFYNRSIVLPNEQILYWGCLMDDIIHLEKVLSEIVFVPDKIHMILIAGICAKAKQIVTKFIKKIDPEYAFRYLWEAIKTNDADIFTIVLKECISLKVDLIKVLIYVSDCAHSNTDILFVTLLQIDYGLVKEKNQELVKIIQGFMKLGYVNGYKMLFAWISLHDDKNKMNQLALDLLPAALQNRNDYFIKHLLRKNSFGLYRNPLINLDVIINTLKTIPVVFGAPPLTTKFLLSLVNTGNFNFDKFMAHELLPLLFKLGDCGGLGVAVSTDNLGQPSYPFIKVSSETVAMALHKCCYQLSNFPVEIVNDYIDRNPNCYMQDHFVYAVLTSAKNGTPIFSAMDRYCNFDYLIRLFTDSSFQNELHNFSYAYYAKNNVSESMFTLLNFSPELNAAITKVFTRRVLGNHKGKSLYNIVFSMLLSKRDDGRPKYESFRFTRNVLPEVGVLRGPFGTTLLESYDGHILYGLSLTYLDESGQERHILAELPVILKNDVKTIRSIVEVLLKTDNRGNFVLKDINESLVRGIAQGCGIRWYSEVLHKELESSQPPWP